MSKKGKKNKVKNEINIPLIYLFLDIIILFVLCLLEINFIKHEIVLGISFLIEFLATVYVANKSNIRTTILFYVLLLVSPIFLGLIAMAVAYLSGKTPYTATLIVLFRNGFYLNGNIAGVLTRVIILFRIPALIGILVSLLTSYVNKKVKKVSQEAWIKNNDLKKFTKNFEIFLKSTWFSGGVYYNNLIVIGES